MIELKHSFNLLVSINAYLAKRREELGRSDTGTLKPRVLTQEKDGIVIYTWNDLVVSQSKPDSSNPVTHIGLYDPTSQQHKVVWTYDTKVKIVSCSINQNKTLLAFTTVTIQKTDDGKSGKDLFQAYLVELQASDSRVFSLNLEKSCFLKVQFLYPGHGEQMLLKEAFLLVFLHKESVALYSIQLSRFGDKGIYMRDQPKTEQIIQKFVWCQWDPQNQQLHYIYNCRHDNGTVYQKFSSIQFYQNAKNDSMMDLPLNFPFPHIRSKFKSRYADRPLCPGIPDVAVNATVLTQPNGTICICYKHHKSQSNPAEYRSDSQTHHDEESINYYICMVHHAKTIQGCVSGLSQSILGSRRLSFHWLGDYLMVLLPGFFVHLLNVSIEYEPCHHIMLHNENKPLKSKVTLSPAAQSCGPLPVSFTSDVEEKDHKPATVRFQESEEHTLCTSPQPVSIQEVTDEEIPVTSVISENARTIHTLSSCTGFCKDISSSSICLYDYHSGCVWRLSVSLDDLFQCFRTAYSSTRQALFHYLLLKSKDLFTLKKVFADICQDATNPEIPTALVEFLITTTYSSMKRQLGREVLRLLPFTSVDTFRGQFVKDSAGVLFARLSYTALGSINFSTKTARDRMSRKHEDIWDILRKHLRLKQIDAPKRFLQDKVKGTYTQHIRNEKRRLSWEYVSKEQSFLGHVTAGSCNRSVFGESTLTVADSFPGRQSRADTVLGAVPGFLKGGLGEDNTAFNILLSLTEQMLTGHLTHHLKKDSRVKAQNVAKEYVSCQVQQSRQLCHILWSVAGFTPEESMPDLSEPGSDEEYELFQLLERFYLTVTEKSFPLPSGFRTYFTALGFRCMQLNLFLQYVDHGVLELTGDFISQLLTDVPDDGDDGENVKLKYAIISRLPKTAAEECFKLWNHPLCLRYFAHHQVAEILLETTSTPAVKSSSKSDATWTVKDRANSEGRDNVSTASDSSVCAGVFQPLASLIDYLEKKTEERDSFMYTLPQHTPVFDIPVTKHWLGLEEKKQLKNGSTGECSTD
ncbi:gamma-secretase-activating protein-like isoform X2 [Gigantopelta aegis]|uniref:gamma-secretase-activating protein-like isoform X2 n=1 Tax=Gigantopelta aegis TaxID=1735272 RepID=UPI001B88C67B|nr:gamma-secretase-activating protein-like isoform X2 [Gigantopelta aegis]